MITGFKRDKLNANGKCETILDLYLYGCRVPRFITRSVDEAQQ